MASVHRRLGLALIETERFRLTKRNLKHNLPRILTPSKISSLLILQPSIRLKKPGQVIRLISKRCLIVILQPNQAAKASFRCASPRIKAKSKTTTSRLNESRNRLQQSVHVTSRCLPIWIRQSETCNHNFLTSSLKTHQATSNS